MSAEKLKNSEENTRRIKHVEDCFGASGQTLQIEGRVLVGEGVLTKLCRKRPKPRQVFLFNDILVYGNILLNKKKFNKQHILALEEIKIIALNDEGNFVNGWQIISPSKSFAVYAATPSEKQEWMAHISRSIEDLIKKTGKTPSGAQAAVWVPDQSTNVCMACQKTKFTALARRHHCRQCGSVVCGPCSTKKLKIPHISSKPVRICDVCNTKQSSGQVEPTDHIDNAVQHLEIGNSESLSRKEAEKITESGSSAEESDEEDDNSPSVVPTFYDDKRSSQKSTSSNRQPRNETSSEPVRPAAPPCDGPNVAAEMHQDVV